MSGEMIVGAAVVRDGALLAQQRSYPEDAAGLWELPGGRVEPRESEADALRRECAEELGAEIVVGARVGEDVVLPGGKVLRVYGAVLAAGSGEPRPVEHKALRWVTAAELPDVEWLPADRVLVPALEALLGG